MLEELSYGHGQHHEQSPHETQDVNKHPKGLYVLFATEMWERFSFYSMLALFTLYLREPDRGIRMDRRRGDGALRELPDVRLRAAR